MGGHGHPKDGPLLRRALAWAAFGALSLAGALGTARAQQPINAAPPPAPQAWQFNVAPYLWLPTIHSTLNYNLPALSARLPTEVSSGPGDYLSHVDIAAALAADARNGRFSVFTDVLYMRLSNTPSHLRSLDLPGLASVPIDRSLQTSTGTTLRATVWTLAGGYTVARGEWGNLDVFAGLRLLGVRAQTNFSLALPIQGPEGNGGTLGRVGGVSGSSQIWNGIAGLRGNVHLGQTRLFVPYYVDIGGGGSHPTWQVSSGLGYQFGWGAVSAVYRYLSFNQSSAPVVKKLTLRGPMLMADFTF